MDNNKNTDKLDSTRHVRKENRRDYLAMVAFAILAVVLHYGLTAFKAEINQEEIKQVPTPAAITPHLETLIQNPTR